MTPVTCLYAFIALLLFLGHIAPVFVEQHPAREKWSGCLQIFNGIILNVAAVAICLINPTSLIIVALAATLVFLGYLSIADAMKS